MTSTATSTAGSTDSVVLSLTLPELARIVVVPTATLRQRPSLPAALLVVATGCVSELQVTAAVRSCVVLSLKVPIAVNCKP